MDTNDKNARAARRRDNSITAGALLAGGGVAAGGVGAIKASRSIKAGVDDLKKTNKAVRQNVRRAGKAAGAPGRAVAKAGRAMGKIRKFFKLEAARNEVHEFRASEIKKGTMMVDGILVDVAKLEKILAKKPVLQIPYRDVKGIGRTKGLSKDRLRGVAGSLNKPGIIATDGTLIDGRHRSRMRKADDIDFGLFRRATKADLKAAEVKVQDLSAKIRATYFMSTEEPPVAEKVKKKKKKAIQHIGRILRFSAKENREERYARIYNNGDDLIKAGASGAAAGGMVGGPAGAVVGGGAAVAGQLGTSRVAARKEEDRKPIQSNVIRNAIPAALVGVGAGLSTDKGQKIMKKTKAVGRLLRRKLKHLEAKRDSTEFKAGGALMKIAQGATEGAAKAAKKSPKFRQRVARKIAGIRDGEKVVGISKTGKRVIKGAAVAASGATIGKMAYDVSKSEQKHHKANAKLTGEIQAKGNFFPTKEDSSKLRESQKNLHKNTKVRSGALKGSVSGGVIGGVAAGLPGYYVGSQIGGIAGAQMGVRTDKKPKKKKELSSMALLQSLEAKLDGAIELARRDEPRRGPGQDGAGQFIGGRPVGWGKETPYVLNPKYRAKEKGRVVDDRGDDEKESLIRDTRSPIEIPEVRRSFVRDAKTVNKWGGRAGRAIKDASDVVRGKPRQKDAAGREKKREWEKSYAKSAIATGATTAGLFVAANHVRNSPKTQARIAKVGRKAKGVGDKALKAMAKYGMEVGELRAGMLHEFVTVTDDKGRQVFRVEDARGNSARIHSGDKPKRDRRPKRWHEKVENERKLAGAGMVAAGGAGLLIGSKGKQIGKAVSESKLYGKAKASKVGKHVAKGVDRMVSPKKKIIREIAKKAARGLN
jgi:hypothetical protein